MQCESDAHPAWKIKGVAEHLSMQTIYDQATLRQVGKITNDMSHILHGEYKLLPSGMRYRVPCCRLNQFKYLFIPVSIKLLNSTR